MKECAHCLGLSQSRLLHRVAAECGRGLPAVARGMPPPAGTGLTRRTFVTKGIGAALAVYGASRLGVRTFEDGIAAASATAEPVLVSIFLEGGLDGMSVLSPQGDPLYRRLRPQLGLSGGAVFREDARLHWHPAAGGIAQLYDEGKVSVLPAVGYTNADQSHFTSRHYWEVGATDPALRTGWLGRYLDVVGAPDNPLQGLSLDAYLAPALATARVPVASIDGPDRYDFGSAYVFDDVEARMLASIGGGGTTPADPALAATVAVASNVGKLRRQLGPLQGKGIESSAPYPSPDSDFPRRLASVASMLAAGLPLRVVSLTAPGDYDTHAAQSDALTQGLQQTSDAVFAFQRDLEARGLADRVLVHIWSEFGRRGKENGDAGTDHGAAGVGFVIGTHARGEMVGEFPSLASGLDTSGNLTATSDFRGMYAALLEQWFGVDATQIIPNASSFARPAIVK